MKQALQNVWFDTAASPYLYIPDVYRVAGEVVGYKRILFGSDYPLIKPQRYFKEMKLANLSEEAFTGICGLNAKALLGSQD